MAQLLLIILFIPTLLFFCINFIPLLIVFKKITCFLSRRKTLTVLIILILLLILLFLLWWIFILKDSITEKLIIFNALDKKMKVYHDLSLVTNSTTIANRWHLHPIDLTGVKLLIFLVNSVKTFSTNVLIKSNLQAAEGFLLDGSIEYMNINSDTILSLIVNQYEDSYQIKLQLNDFSLKTLNPLELSLKDRFAVYPIEITLEQPLLSFL